MKFKLKFPRCQLIIEKWSHWSGRHVALRLLAKLVDLFLMIFVAWAIPGVLGSALGCCYAWGSDTYGASLGKRLFGFFLVDYHSNQVLRGRPGWKASWKRNALIGIPMCLTFISLWGWILGFLLAVPLCAFEAYAIVMDPEGRRWGDRLAETRVDFSPTPWMKALGELWGPPQG